MKFNFKYLSKILLFIIMFILLDLCCPIKLLFKIKCPTCGLSTAWINFIQGNLQKAFENHPLFFTGPIIIYLVCLNERSKIEDLILVLIAICIFIIYGYKSLFG